MHCSYSRTGLIILFSTLLLLSWANIAATTEQKETQATNKVIDPKNAKLVLQLVGDHAAKDHLSSVQSYKHHDKQREIWEGKKNKFRVTNQKTWLEWDKAQKSYRDHSNKAENAYEKAIDTFYTNRLLHSTVENIDPVERTLWPSVVDKDHSEHWRTNTKKVQASRNKDLRMQAARADEMRKARIDEISRRRPNWF